jgi:hypothetical protein
LPEPCGRRPRERDLLSTGRGGWYGWNPLEREDTGVPRLLADLPPPKVGDVWLDGPGCDETKGTHKVLALEPPRTLVLHFLRDPVTGRELDAGWEATLVHRYRVVPPGSDRLRPDTALARTRIRTEPSWALLPIKCMGGGTTVMQRRLLDGIKARVEATNPDPKPC